MKSVKICILSIFFVSVMSLLQCSGYAGPTAEEFNDTSKALHIIVESDPPGAKVYTVDGKDTGIYLGQTPYTFKFIYKRIGDRPYIWGEHYKETIVQGDNIFSYVLNSPFYFQCFLVEDGYKMTHVYKKLENRERPDPRNTSSSSAFLPGVVKVSVPLEKL